MPLRYYSMLLCTAALLMASLPFSLKAQPSTTAAASYSQPADIPVEAFFRREQFSQMAISPDGRKLAALAPLGGRNNLAIIELDKLTSKVITSYKSVDVAEFSWLSNNRLLLRVADLQEETGSFRYRGTYAVDMDGTNVRDLSRPTSYRTKTGTATIFRVLARTTDGSGEVIAEMNERNRAYTDVYRYDTVAGTYQLQTADTPGNVQRWLLDRNLVPRVVVRLEERQDAAKPRVSSVWHRGAIGEAWERIGETDGANGIQPVAFDYDNRTLYVSAAPDGNRRAIYKYDIANRKLGELVMAHPLVDLSGGLIFSSEKKKLAGIRYSAENPAVKWFDEAMAGLQAQLDKSLPGTVNAFMAADDAARYILVHASSATEPGTYYLYDSEKRTLERVARSREWLPPALMAERKFIQYPTRDGLSIPAWLTLPRGNGGTSGKNLPLVVHIHGGPWVRSYHGIQWGRWPVAQFLASRGYAVLEPEPRGSTGFGNKHYRAGFKQWGLAMQDDITDGALQLVKDGIVDRSRMCLFGGSYGGYATLQGLVKDPDLWRCGSAYIAVTDLELLQTVGWSDTARLTDHFETDYKRYVGDKDVDREQFLKTSPARNAARIKGGLMLTMGGSDERVPLIHGNTMKAALESANIPVEYVVYQGEAHGFNKQENVVDFYTRLERFLATHLRK